MFEKGSSGKARFTFEHNGVNRHTASEKDNRINTLHIHFIGVTIIIQHASHSSWSSVVN